MDTDLKYKMTKSEHSETCNFGSDEGEQENTAISPVYRQSKCAIDNSNDNNRGTVIQITSQQQKEKLTTNENNIKLFNEIDFNLLPSNENKEIKHTEELDVETAEILISIDKSTGELNVDVLSLEGLAFFDKNTQTVLASTFDESVQYKYQDIFTKCILGLPNNATEDTRQYTCPQSNSPCNSTDINDTVNKKESCLNECKDVTPDINRETPSPGGGDHRVYNGIHNDKSYTHSDNNSNYTEKHVRFEVEPAYENKSNYDNRRRSRDQYYKKHWTGNQGSDGNEWYTYNYDKKYDDRYNQRKEFYRDGTDRQNSYRHRHVISFSESDLVYSSRYEKQNRHNRAPPTPQVKKQITILKRGCTLKSEPDEILQKSDAQDELQIPSKDEGCDPSQTEVTTDGESVPYGRYSLNITTDRRYYSDKYPQHGEGAEDADVSGDTEEDQKQGKNRKVSKYRKGNNKQKAKKPPKKRIPKTRLEVFQNQVKAGQLRSVFSRWKTDNLKRIKLVEELHNGTFAIKYKAIYNNEMVVLSVYIDQDTSDINPIDMVHLRNSKFIDGLRDCMTGPYASLWLLSRYYHYGDLQKLLFRDPDRHVIGEVHAQFILAGLVFGLDYLHQHGIVHGNIKPSKILINRHGFPVLTGYLIVDETILEERRDVYTPAYAAPERFRGHRGTAIDIFSMGCLGYEIVTGRTPFDDGNLEALRSNILNHSYRPLFEPELFSYAGEMFIDSCMRKPLKYRFTIGNNRENFMCEEWFSTLDLYQIERQNAYSPILQAMKEIESSTTLSWRQKTVEFNWGRALDIARPDWEPDDKLDWHFMQDCLLEFF